jgi:hypothetical protein
MTAVDLAVVGLQKRPISFIVSRVGVIKVLGCVLLEQAVFTSSSASFVVDWAVGDDDFDAVVLTFGASVLGAISTAFMAAIFAFKLGMFSRHFFFWLHFPCPGPGMVHVGARGSGAGFCKTGSGSGSGSVTGLVLCNCELKLRMEILG